MPNIGLRACRRKYRILKARKVEWPELEDAMLLVEALWPDERKRKHPTRLFVSAMERLKDLLDPVNL